MPPSWTKQIHHYVDRPVNLKRTISAAWPTTYSFQYVKPFEDEDKKPRNIYDILKLKPVNDELNPTYKADESERLTQEQLNQIGLGHEQTNIIDFDDDSAEIFTRKETDQESLPNLLFSPSKKETNLKDKEKDIKSTSKRLQSENNNKEKKENPKRKKTTHFFPVLNI